MEYLPASEDVRTALSKLRPLGTPSELLLTAFVVLVSRLTGDEDIPIGTNGEQFLFVSSTSVLDTDHYVSESERSIVAGGEGISETDDLQGSRTGLGTGYGQSK